MVKCVPFPKGGCFGGPIVGSAVSCRGAPHIFFDPAESWGASGVGYRSSLPQLLHYSGNDAETHEREARPSAF